ncbi:hypothetical protein TRFO_21627 [Tritrichomonas foetus]|uniref:Importin N-terminal domain-containing protein n=1 Tax=Tritrichomonas foetus TaxID=1144522 RepID=A0A1J4KD98_9EUKA|nr:hypothetical protein TRFO_21627 [Tritrichomonas foetus]|eukprot:OHT09409.1 hypothetical protein TRFO_21627 [Tritrichomonas foetus]
MERVQFIESLIIGMNSGMGQDATMCDNQLREWTESDFVISDSIYLLTNATNPLVKNMVMTVIRNCIKTRKKPLQPDELNNLATFLTNFTVTHILEKDQAPWFRFALISLADIAVLSKDLPIVEIFGYYPIDVQMSIATYYFEEWLSKFYTKFINQSYYPVPEIILRYVNDMLRSQPVSIQWMNLYHCFALGLENFQPLLPYIPKLIEATKIIDLSATMIEHISTVLNFDMTKGPDEYHFAIANISIHLSSVLREAAAQDPMESKYAVNLILLWMAVWSLEDSEEYFFKPDFINITVSLINEFTLAENIMVTSAQITKDIELWPALLIASMRFCENFSEDCPVASFAVNVLELVLTGLNFGVELSSIHEKLNNFYKASENLLNAYFMNPNIKFPSILLIIGYLNSSIPQQIQEAYCTNFQSFNAPPETQIYFAQSFVSKDEKYLPAFVNVFTTFFNDYPHECSLGFYKLICVFPVSLNPEVVERLSFYMTNIPFIQQEFLIPSIIILLMHLPNDDAAKYYTSVGNTIITAFAEAMQNKNNLLAFFDMMHKILEKLPNINFNSESFKLFENFGQQIFEFISRNLSNVWLDPSKEIQHYLSQFLFEFFHMNFIANPRNVAAWLNQIIAIAPCPSHLTLLYFLRDFIQVMPNVCEFIRNLDPSKRDFLYELLPSLQSIAMEWDNNYWNLIPPQIPFAEMMDEDRGISSLACTALMELLPSQPVEFHMQVLQTIINAMVNVYKNPAFKELAELIIKLKEFINPAMILEAINSATPMASEEQEAFIRCISVPNENSVNDLKDILTKLLARKNCI